MSDDLFLPNSMHQRRIAVESGSHATLSCLNPKAKKLIIDSSVILKDYRFLRFSKYSFVPNSWMVKTSVLNQTKEIILPKLNQDILKTGHALDALLFLSCLNYTSNCSVALLPVDFQMSEHAGRATNSADASKNIILLYKHVVRDAYVHNLLYGSNFLNLFIALINAFRIFTLYLRGLFAGNS